MLAALDLFRSAGALLSAGAIRYFVLELLAALDPLRYFVLELPAALDPLRYFVLELLAALDVIRSSIAQTRPRTSLPAASVIRPSVAELRHALRSDIITAEQLAALRHHRFTVKFVFELLAALDLIRATVATHLAGLLLAARTTPTVVTNRAPVGYRSAPPFQPEC